MKGLIRLIGKELFKPATVGLYRWVEVDKYALLGVYDDTMFEGSDRLSMAVMGDNQEALIMLHDKIVFAEGDRFTNKTFIEDFNPYVIFIKDDGTKGRALRGSSQTERHIKSIQTRVNNIPYDCAVNTSEQALYLITNMIAKDEFPEPEIKNNSPLNFF